MRIFLRSVGICGPFPMICYRIGLAGRFEFLLRDQPTVTPSGSPHTAKLEGWAGRSGIRNNDVGLILTRFLDGNRYSGFTNMGLVMLPT